MKKILIPNGSFHDIPLIYAAKNLGYYVITSGNRSELPGHSYADKYVPCDYSNKEELLKVAEENNIDVICSNCNDFGFLSTCYIAEKLKLGGHDSYQTALTLHNKDLFKEVAEKIGLKTPKSKSFDNEADAIEYVKGLNRKIIIKPIDGNHGRGITESSSNDASISGVKEAFNASINKKIVIEDFIEGRLHSASCFLLNKKVIFTFVEEGYTHSENIHAVKCAISPARVLEKIKNQINEETEKIAKYLNLVDGKIHMNIIVDKNDNIHILEMHRRCSGGIYPPFIELSTGVNWAEWIVKAETNCAVDNFPRNTKQFGFQMTYCICPKKNGILKRIVISDKMINKIRRMYIFAKEGYEISDCRYDMLGVLNIEFDSYEEIKEYVSQIDNLIVIEYQ